MKITFLDSGDLQDHRKPKISKQIFLTKVTTVKSSSYVSVVRKMFFFLKFTRSLYSSIHRKGSNDLAGSGRFDVVGWSAVSASAGGVVDALSSLKGKTGSGVFPKI